MARRRRASQIEIVFETHSTTTDNERWIASGWLDGQLSPLGRRQAAELGDRRADDELVAVFCSDLARATETARIAFGGLGVRTFHDWRLRECNYGMLNGTPVARLEAERTRHVVDPYPGGESYVDVVARVRSFLHDLPPRFADERIAVIGHSATKWALDHLLEGTPLEELVEGSFRWQPGWLYTLAVDS
ncbi:MAG TPA: histidine phosphatase family protein [Gaiellaceae bacterium]|jgi:2,3-bisphosphoglycerate-dependent phosphoglycerate mutase|nr:histidine phosphatase family protein [Gaiellaceae bacterium]